MVQALMFKKMPEVETEVERLKVRKQGLALAEFPEVQLRLVERKRNKYQPSAALINKAYGFRSVMLSYLDQITLHALRDISNVTSGQYHFQNR